MPHRIVVPVRCSSGICQKVTDVLGVFSSGTPVDDEAFPVSCADTPDYFFFVLHCNRVIPSVLHGREVR